jgi:cardiolipin synthase
MAVASSGRAGRDAGAPRGAAAAPLSAFPQHIANLLTLGRLACAVPLAGLVTAGRLEGAFYVFLGAALSDLLDGYIAKRFNGCSRVGAILDPTADKVLIASIFTALALVGAVPAWLAVGIVARDLLIVGGAVLLRRRLSGVRIEPLLIGKLCTFLQLLFGGFVIGHLAGIADVGAIVAVLMPLTAALTLASALAYLAMALRLGAAPPAAA